MEDRLLPKQIAQLPPRLFQAQGRFPLCHWVVPILRLLDWVRSVILVFIFCECYACFVLSCADFLASNAKKPIMTTVMTRKTQTVRCLGLSCSLASATRVNRPPTT